MSEIIKLSPPLRNEDIQNLTIGDRVEITGKIFTARDAAHKRMTEGLDTGKGLPFDIKGQIIYFVGPTPARPGRPIGSAGPTTSSRMDLYSPRLIEMGLKGMIGKGWRSKEVIDSMVRYGCIYFVAVGGAGALLSRCIKKSEVIAYEDLGPEAIHLLEVENFPVIVVNDMKGKDLYKEGTEKFARR
ncbi:MAG TPA: Fe-S-containing hydro-lyase [Nitrospinota bacterium]|nr:Fe-S-containing hydro-lyase [Nitrospinota bacterium]